MNKIQHRIVMLSITIIVIMAGFWGVMSFLNYQSMKYYHVTLERYLLLNEISNVSISVLIPLNDYKNSPELDKLRTVEEEVSKLKEANARVRSLKNDKNEIKIENYKNMVESQIEAMDMMIRAVKIGQPRLSENYYDESVNTAQFVNETTLSLLKMEITEHEQIYQRMITLGKSITSLGVTTLCSVFLFLLFLSYIFSKGITKSIEKLTKGAKEISKGNYDNPINVQSKDEILFLANTFNQMRQNIKESILEIKAKAKLEKEVKEYELILKDSELRLLQSQMNPHFLFNTLNTLSKKAYIEGAKETSELIVTVANLLRYNLRNFDVPVTLQEELDIIHEYMSILQARFPNRVGFQLSVDTNMLDIVLPSLILQPLVENAFLHSIEPLEFGGTIKIEIEETEKYIVAHIKDDGVGMKEEKRQSILQADKHHQSHGLYSVIKRLRIFYGKEDVLTISSKEKEGTCISIKLYKKREGEQEVDYSISM